MQLPGEVEIADSAFDSGGDWVFICPQGQSKAAAYASAKGRPSYGSVLWLGDADSVPADIG